MPIEVELTPELECFARNCVNRGRYADISEVIRAALRLLQQTKPDRQAFRQMLADTAAEADRLGAVPLETMLAEVDAIIAACETHVPANLRDC